MQQLTVLQINDVHGYIEEHYDYFIENDKLIHKKVGGYSRIKTIYNQSLSENENVLFVDGGDTFYGTKPVVDSKGEILIPILNDLNLDAMVGHWDFAFGPKHLGKLINKLNYPFLAINCYKKEDDSLAYQPTVIKQFNNIKVGIIGIAATIIDKTMPKHFSKGLYFTLGNKELPYYIKKLKDEGVDLIVVTSHLGFPQDVKIAKEVAGIDVYLSAHTHNRLDKPVIINDTIIIQSGSHGNFMTKLDLTIENKKIVKYDHKLITLDSSIKKDQKMGKLIEDLKIEYDTTVVGKTKSTLDRYLNLESNMDNLLLKAMLKASNTEIGFSNGWRYGASILKGDITINDLHNLIPVNPFISTVKLSGQEIFDMLEENLENTYASDPFKQMGGYVKRVMGLKIYFKIENPNNYRIIQIFHNNQQLNRSKNYKVCYVTSQGVSEKYGVNHQQLKIRAIDALKDYLKDNNEVDIKFNNPFILV